MATSQRGTGVALYRAGRGELSEELTRRELEIVALVAEGLTNVQIAARLNRSHWTVHNQLMKIFMRLNVHSRVDLARYAFQNGIVKI